MRNWRERRRREQSPIRPHHRDAFELSTEPVRFDAVCGIIVTTLWNRKAGFHDPSILASGYGVTVRESLLSLLAEVNPKAVEQFENIHGTDADSTAGSKSCDTRSESA